MHRVFAIPSGHDAQIQILITEPDLRANGLTLQTWTSSFVLASLLHKLKFDISPSNVPVLELGAGTGLSGLTAATLWKVPVILTELESMVPGLADNIALNSSTVKELVRCGSLDWATPEFLVLPDGRSYSAQADKAQVIMAADTVYSEEHPELLSKAILAWLAPGPNSRVLLTYPLRVAYLDQIRELWELLEAGGLEAMSEGREQADVADWDDECLCEWSIWKWKTPEDATSSAS